MIKLQYIHSFSGLVLLTHHLTNDMLIGKNFRLNWKYFILYKCSMRLLKGGILIFFVCTLTPLYSM